MLVMLAAFFIAKYYFAAPSASAFYISCLPGEQFNVCLFLENLVGSKHYTVYCIISSVLYKCLVFYLNF
jgi:hypothetical protein